MASSLEWANSKEFKELPIEGQAFVYKEYFDQKIADDEFRKLPTEVQKGVFSDFLNHQGMAQSSSTTGVTTSTPTEPKAISQPKPSAIAVPEQRSNIDSNTMPSPSAGMDTGVERDTQRGIPKPVDLLKRKTAIKPEGPFPTPFGDSSAPIDMPEERGPSQVGGILNDAMATTTSGIKGIAAGSAMVGESVGAFGQWAGKRLPEAIGEPISKIGKSVADYYEKQRVAYAPPKRIQGNVWEKPRLMADPEWLSYNIGNIAPSVIAAILPGIGLSKVLKIGGAAVKLTPVVIERLAKIGMAAGAGTAGGGMEGLGTYRELLAKGKPEEEASNAGIIMGAMSAALNTIGFGKMLSKATGSTLQKAGKHVISGATEAVTEVAEEPSEVIAKDIAEYLQSGKIEPGTWSRMVDATKEGLNVALPSFIMGAGGSALQKNQAPVEKEELIFDTDPQDVTQQAIDPTKIMLPDQMDVVPEGVDYRGAIADVEKILANGGTVEELEEAIAGNQGLMDALAPTIAKYKNQGETLPDQGELPSPLEEPSPGSPPVEPVSPIQNRINESIGVDRPLVVDAADSARALDIAQNINAPAGTEIGGSASDSFSAFTDAGLAREESNFEKQPRTVNDPDIAVRADIQARMQAGEIWRSDFKPFKNKVGVKKEIKDKGLDVADFEIKSVDGGFHAVPAPKDRGSERADSELESIKPPTVDVKEKAIPKGEPVDNVEPDVPGVGKEPWEMSREEWEGNQPALDRKNYVNARLSEQGVPTKPTSASGKIKYQEAGRKAMREFDERFNAKHEGIVKQAIEEGKIDSHPDYPDLKQTPKAPAKEPGEKQKKLDEYNKRIADNKAEREKQEGDEKVVGKRMKEYGVHFQEYNEDGELSTGATFRKKINGWFGGKNEAPDRVISTIKVTQKGAEKGITEARQKKAQTLANKLKTPVAYVVFNDEGGVPTGGAFVEMPQDFGKNKFDTALPDNVFNGEIRNPNGDMIKYGNEHHVAYPAAEEGGLKSQPTPEEQRIKAELKSLRQEQKEIMEAVGGNLNNAAYSNMLGGLAPTKIRHHTNKNRIAALQKDLRKLKGQAEITVTPIDEGNSITRPKGQGLLLNVYSSKDGFLGKIGRDNLGGMYVVKDDKVVGEGFKGVAAARKYLENYSPELTPAKPEPTSNTQTPEIRKSKGEPFKKATAAKGAISRLARKGRIKAADYEVVEVDGGFVGRFTDKAKKLREFIKDKKPSGLPPNAKLTNDPAFNGYAWRSMTPGEFKKLDNREKEYGGGKAKKGNYFAPAPGSAAKYNGKGDRYLVEFGGIERAEGETVSNDKVTKDNITRIWKWDKESKNWYDIGVTAEEKIHFQEKRNAKIKQRAVSKAKNIRQWIAAMGGLKRNDTDRKGDWDDIFGKGKTAAHGWPVEFFNHTTGQGFDIMYYAAKDHGWIGPETTEDEFMEAITNGASDKFAMLGSENALDKAWEEEVKRLEEIERQNEEDAKNAGENDEDIESVKESGHKIGVRKAKDERSEKKESLKLTPDEETPYEKKVRLEKEGVYKPGPKGKSKAVFEADKNIERKGDVGKQRGMFEKDAQEDMFDDIPFSKSITKNPKGLSRKKFQVIQDGLLSQAKGFTGEVIVHDSQHDLTPAELERFDINPFRNINRGLFDPKTGNIHIFLDGINDKQEGVMTLLEELFHSGVKAVVPKSVLIDIYGRVKDTKEMDWLHDHYSKLDPNTESGQAALADEYLAKQIKSETLPEQIWNKIVAAVRKMLRAAGINVKFTRNEIKAMVRRAVETGKVERVPGAKTGVNQFAQPVRKSLAQAVKSVLDNPKFVKWFGDSKVLNAKGEPLVVVHETRELIREFIPGGVSERMAEEERALLPPHKMYEAGAIDNAYRSGPVIYFGDMGGGVGSGRDMSKPGTSKYDSPKSVPVYLSLKNPAIIKSEKDRKSTIEVIGGVGVLGRDFPYTVSTKQKEELSDLGYDGIIIDIPGQPKEYIAFNPTQIKSIYNQGTFDSKNPDIRKMVAFHGTPHVWPPEPGFPNGRPRLDKIGTGEGGAAYGWGWYSAEEEGTAKQYTDNFDSVGLFNINGKEYYVNIDGDVVDAKTEKAVSEKDYDILHSLYASNFDKEAAIEDLKYRWEGKKEKEQWLKDGIQQIKDAVHESQTSLYELDIPDNVIPKLLDWDLPLSEQTEYVKKALINIKGINTGYKGAGGTRELRGSEIYSEIAGLKLSKQAASEYLASIGIPGNTHGGVSQGATGKKYVIWDQAVLDKVALLKRNQKALKGFQEAQPDEWVRKQIAPQETLKHEKAWATPQQEVSSAKTSLSYKTPDTKRPVIFTEHNKGNIKLGKVNADIGGGKYDQVSDWLKKRFGIKNLVWDRFNRDGNHNDKVQKQLQGGKADTATISNVLNVIDEPQSRVAVLETARDAVKNGGKVFISVYKAPKAGDVKGRDSYQEGENIKAYLPEIEFVFGKGNIEVKKNIAVATKRKISQPDEWVRKSYAGERENPFTKALAGVKKPATTKDKALKSTGGAADTPIHKTIAWSSKGIDWSKDGLRNTASKLYTAMIMREYPIARMAGKAGKEAREAIENIIRKLRGIGGVTEVLLNSTNLDSLKGDTELGPYFKYVSKSLKTILTPIRSKGMYRDYEAMRVAQREISLDLANQTREKQIKGLDPKGSKETIRILKEKYGDKGFAELEAISKEHRNFERDVILRPLLDSGWMSQEIYDKITKSPESEYYASFLREMDEIEDKVGSGGSPVRELYGSEKKKIPSVEGTIANVQRTVRLIEQQNLNKAIVSLKDLTSDLDDIIKLKPPSFQNIPGDFAVYKIADNNKTVTQAIKVFKTEGEARSFADNKKGFIVVKRPNKSVPSGKIPNGTIVVAEDGKKKYYSVPNDVFKAVQGTSPSEMKTLIKILSIPARLLRAGATLSLDFMARNPVRDQMTATVYSKFGYNPFIDFGKGVFHMLGNTDLYAEYKASGAEQSYFVSLDREGTELKSRDVLSYKGATKEKILTYTNPLKALQKMSELSEKGTRLGLYANARKKSATSAEAMAEARDATLDFGRIGTYRALNQVIAFFNANIQGTDKMVRVLKDPKQRGKSLLKIGLGITIPSIALWFYNNDDDEPDRKKRYQDLPGWRKNFFFNVVIDNGPIISIPKPFELGLIFGSLPERILDYIYYNDPKALKSIAVAIKDGAMPGLIPTVALAPIEYTTNYSYFRGKPLENAALEGKPQGMRYTAFTPEIAKSVGSMAGISPIKFQNWVKGWTGTLGGDAMKLMDYAYSDQPPVVGKKWYEKTPMVKGFVAKEPIGPSSKSMGDYYDNVRDISQVHRGIAVLKSNGDRNVLIKYAKSNVPEIRFYKKAQHTSKKLSTWRKKRDAVVNSKKVTSEKKRELVDIINTKMSNIAFKFNKQYNYFKRVHPTEEVK